MNQILALIIFFIVHYSSAQKTEFGSSINGLIYPDSTIQKLRYIVDSLNLKFRVCDFNKIYLSPVQAIAHYVSIDTGNIKEARKSMESNISFDKLVNKYKPVTVEKDLVVTKLYYSDYDGNKMISFSTLPLNHGYYHDLEFNQDQQKFERPLKGRWIIRYFDKSEYSSESVDAFYFTEEFRQTPIPGPYANMIQYADCMVDTSALVFREATNTGNARHRKEEFPKQNEFLEYIHVSTSRPEYSESNQEQDYTAYMKRYGQWDSLRLSRVDSLQKNNPKFYTLMNDALDEAIHQGGSDDEFEEYVGLYISKKTELELKRSRRVVGFCSQDISPRLHAFNIAKLSAETINWEIFLRAHLDIMNDRFDRASDGSYAWKNRQTYIRELEVLDINVQDLLLGISLQVANPSTNHYFGSIGRLGRALSETEKPQEIEAKMLQMISDEQLMIITGS
jgi:hypothetical protein